MLRGAISFGGKYPLVPRLIYPNLTTQDNAILRRSFAKHLAQHLNSLRRYGQRHASHVGIGRLSTAIKPFKQLGSNSESPISLTLPTP